MLTAENIVFSRPYRTEKELPNIEAVLESGHVHGDGPFTAAATQKLKQISGAQNALLTTSCTHALEMSSLLLGLAPGDEVIMPSFTFPSAATAIALSGATPVFVDIDMTSGNVDVASAEQAITPRTKALSVVHYAGVAADMASLLALSSEYGLPIIEDNAHGLGGQWQGRSLGTIGSVGTQSFHDTKNIHCGEGGALLVNDQSLMERAEMIREKGTDRSRFLRGQVDKYTWTDIGSSYLLSELNAAVLDSQLAEFDSVQAKRHAVWDDYAENLADWADDNGATLMHVPDDRQHTAHMFYILMPTHHDQMGLIAHLRANGISAPFHYIPLDSSPGGLRYGRTPDACIASAEFSSRLVRLPLWAGLSTAQVDRVIDGVLGYAAVGRATMVA
ncbi:dTDP-4-amino-4,6-dideoxygalactose transaminase [Salinibacterium sp. ZJ450]|uniref:dTDP-4-amino-4,6-dideoxygalactose transaminase n=1 Tax=Salinibacterium sp. ZJ450 TaxID=2708338 RepID=UPI001CD4416D|nr:dTDP-4-amino-4,6-dideoxygalactose transaminase [Salinibacterium sp. ZJ450]